LGRTLLWNFQLLLLLCVVAVGWHEHGWDGSTVGAVAATSVEGFSQSLRVLKASCATRNILSAGSIAAAAVALLWLQEWAVKVFKRKYISGDPAKLKDYSDAEVALMEVRVVVCEVCFHLKGWVLCRSTTITTLSTLVG
jgi:hypothetical protein